MYNLLNKTDKMTILTISSDKKDLMIKIVTLVTHE